MPAATYTIRSMTWLPDELVCQIFEEAIATLESSVGCLVAIPLVSHQFHRCFLPILHENIILRTPKQIQAYANFLSQAVARPGQYFFPAVKRLVIYSYPKELRETVGSIYNACSEAVEVYLVEGVHHGYRHMNTAVLHGRLRPCLFSNLMIISSVHSVPYCATFFENITHLEVRAPPDQPQPYLAFCTRLIHLVVHCHASGQPYANIVSLPNIYYGYFPETLEILVLVISQRYPDRCGEERFLQFLQSSQAQQLLDVIEPSIVIGFWESHGKTLASAAPLLFFHGGGDCYMDATSRYRPSGKSTWQISRDMVARRPPNPHEFRPEVEMEGPWRGYPVVDRGDSDSEHEFEVSSAE